MSYSKSSPITTHGSSIQPADKDSSVDDMYSEPQSLSHSFPCLYTLKDQREYEHNRQRIKHVADYIQMRARKGREAYPSNGTLPRRGRLSWLPNYFSKTTSANDSERDKEKRDSLSCNTSEQRVEPIVEDEWVDWSGHHTADHHRFDKSKSSAEAKLSDLIVSTRKPRKIKEPDFEFVPHIRSVIVLDDKIPHDITIDEPWEHIAHSDTSDKDSTDVKAPTYASIVSSTPPN
ncbi:hypothetical protein Moror_11006 [Moniliophthora roreri MCA 2997]|uniref:Uncharacterized protein n=2 Tax=Moniliophthora roreri TaxID=221103 RepID=V2Y1E5_MONRO|nr:hypothetical protein Moror_11006 [Moniliophthora roreri MCA 2997]